jgi:hypothetical protein
MRWRMKPEKNVASPHTATNRRSRRSRKSIADAVRAKPSPRVCAGVIVSVTASTQCSRQAAERAAAGFRSAEVLCASVKHPQSSRLLRASEQRLHA